MTATAAATRRPLTPRMTDSLLTALTSQQHMVHGTVPTIRGLITRDYAEIRTHRSNLTGLMVGSLHLTPAGRDHAAKLVKAMEDTDPARRDAVRSADSEAQRIMTSPTRADRPRTLRPFYTETRTDSRGTVIPADHRNHSHSQVRCMVALYILNGAAATRMDTDARHIRVEYTDGHLIEYRAVTPDPAPLGTARPAFTTATPDGAQAGIQAGDTVEAGTPTGPLCPCCAKPSGVDLSDRSAFSSAVSTWAQRCPGCRTHTANTVPGCTGVPAPAVVTVADVVKALRTAPDRMAALGELSTLTGAPVGLLRPVVERATKAGCVLVTDGVVCLTAWGRDRFEAGAMFTMTYDDASRGRVERVLSRRGVETVGAVAARVAARTGGITGITVTSERGEDVTREFACLTV